MNIQITFFLKKKVSSMKMNMRVDRVTPVKMDYVYNGIREKPKIDPRIK